MIHTPEVVPARSDPPVARRVQRILLTAAAVTGVIGVAATLTGPTAEVRAAASGSAPAVVQTESGPVRGLVTDGYRSFQAIPYAAPPVGELRWSGPQPPQPWTGVRDATQPGNACPQPAGIPMGRPSTTEDCLFVNVTTPRHSSKPLPVMVWLHGGSLTYGAGDIYRPISLVTQGDVIVVSVNYRLGALGFLAHPAFDADANQSGNFGLQDQQAALRWVRRNAAAFGGDPHNVTLFGQSAGSFSGCAHLASPASAGLFDKVIMQSGPCTSGWTPATTSAPRPRTVAEQEGLALAESLGCPDLAAAATCLRAKPADELLAATASLPDLGPVLGGPILPIDPAEALATGRFHHVPVIHGYNRDEERLRVWGMEVSGANCAPGVPALPDHPNECPLTEADYREQLNQEFGADADAVAARYSTSAYGSPSEALGAALTDAIWVRSTLDTAAALARHTPTYVYEFADDQAPFFTGAHQPSFPLGSFHTAELPYLFTVGYAQPLTDEQTRLGTQMIDYWTRFAHTGDPNGSGSPTWSRYSSQRVLALAPGTIRTVDSATGHHYAFWRSLNR
ncbi:carboxylesterase family protein [Micromonospora yasonensis]|uniref:carboxylesterase/lipase family protein n=1 Tax=Micromonospora yasonensis TaxID=1128667 RepID=UPI00222EA741|nr:carboxylesterase/lipase family protein [Micromonospora yasonensis]MCW3845105.1 carboxylesterase family protein [Micromonospora yasonensis]